MKAGCRLVSVSQISLVCSHSVDFDGQIVLPVCVCVSRRDEGHRLGSHQDVHEASQHRGQTPPVLDVSRSVCVCVCV